TATRTSLACRTTISRPSLRTPPTSKQSPACKRDTRRTMPSLLLASLHPDGPGGGVCVREPGTARPLGSELKGVSRIGVAVLAPTTAERRDRRWVRELAADLDSAQPDAVV